MIADGLDDPRLRALIGELSLKSPEFRRLWARHEIRAKTTGTKRMLSPEVGEVTVRWESLAVAAAPGQLLVIYFAEPGSPSDAALRQLSDTLSRPA